MNLYYYDDKHAFINGTLDLGPLTEEQLALLSKVIIFLDQNYITNRYKRLILAESYKSEYDSESGTSEIIFNDQVEV